MGCMPWLTSHHDMSDTAGATIWAQISLICPLPQILYVLGMSLSEITPGNVVVTTEQVKGTLASFLENGDCLYNRNKTKVNRMVQICLREGIRALLHLHSMGYHHDNVTEESFFILQGPTQCAKLGRIGCDVRDGLLEQDHIQFVNMVYNMFLNRQQSVPFEIDHFCTTILRRGRLDLADVNHPCVLDPTKRLTFRTLCRNILCERYRDEVHDPNIYHVAGLIPVPIPIEGVTYWSNDPLFFRMYCNNLRKHYQIKWEGVDDADLDMALTYFFPDLMVHMFTMDIVNMSGILLGRL